MSVPAYSDIAKPTGDLLSRDFYAAAAANLEIKTKAPNGVAFTVKGKQPVQNGAISGTLETKYADKASGLTLTQGWTSANVLETKVELSEALVPGLKGELATSFRPSLGTKTAKLGLYFRQPAIHCRGFFDLLSGPSFVGDAVVGHDGFLAGAELGYDVVDGRVTKYSAALGYAVPLYSAAINADSNLSVFSASYFHKVNPSVDAGAKATWDSKSTAQGVKMEVAAKYALDSDSFTKAKINNNGLANFSYSQVLRPGVRLGLGLAVDTQRLSEAAHKVGFSLTFEA
ncbi:hypothetical protein CANCADRAFT_87360 [Tortispora caseinolytica NRRL Y-17796]|uniref:Mitochondrial outer membrane protein porin n=1 Tax=Tortispora caseinolytica NRRL Y-17796 TaxID=767744 RepID=A0A1E4TL58_9ASCO|nr:hypothetical protein CANCADRAFT_87360 [Tortispora caseinolytica NRRL Y-17796]